MKVPISSKLRCLAMRLLVFLGIVFGAYCSEVHAGGVVQDVDLVTHDGHTFSAENLRGKLSLVFFGYTDCPDICPTQLSEMSRLLDGLGSDADRVNAFFVTLNPEHDSQELLAGYLSNFHPKIIGLTGKFAKVKALADLMGARFNRVGDAGKVKSIDHSIMTYLVGSRLDIYGPMLIGHGAKIARTIASIRKMLRKNMETNLESPDLSIARLPAAAEK